MSPTVSILGVLVVLGLLMGILKLFQGRISSELSRKSVHIGMGLVCLSFPWIFRDALPVFLLAALAVGSLAAVRFVPPIRKMLGPVLGGVERQSLGEFYFPISVAIVFALADGNALLYFIPVLTLTVADSVGALVGVRYGTARYRTDDGLKSAEGSVAFFTAAFLSCHIPLLLFGNTGRAETLLISLTAGFLVMLLEAIAWRGQDNLIIPIGMFFLLELYLPMTAPMLVARLVVIVALVIFVLVWRKRTTLSDSAILAGALSGYALWAFGGWVWLLPPMILFLIYVLLPSFPAENRPIQNLRAVTRVMGGAFLWLLIAKTTRREEFLAPYILCMAAHTGNIVTARLRVVRETMTPPKILLAGWLVASVPFCIFAGGAAFFGIAPFFTAVLVPLSVALSIGIFFPAWPTEHTPENRMRIWISEACIAVVASLPGLIFIYKS